MTLPTKKNSCTKWTDVASVNAMPETQPIHLTVPQVAAELGMTSDGVYKLIQRGKLAAERVSARKTRISPAALNEYTKRQQDAVLRFREATPVQDVGALRERFEAQTGRSPEAWLAAWKRDELEDTPENMHLLVRAAALRGGLNQAPISQPATHPWAVAAFGVHQLSE